MNEELIYEKLISKEIAVMFTNIDSFRVFCGFLDSKGIYHKNSINYYWDKYGTKLCVSISDSGNFKCGSNNFYSDQGRELYLYDKKPYIVEIIDTEEIELL